MLPSNTSMLQSVRFFYSVLAIMHKAATNQEAEGETRFSSETHEARKQHLFELTEQLDTLCPSSFAYMSSQTPVNG